MSMVESFKTNYEVARGNSIVEETANFTSRVRGQGKGKCGAGQLTVETKTGEIQSTAGCLVRVYGGHLFLVMLFKVSFSKLPKNLE